MSAVHGSRDTSGLPAINCKGLAIKINEADSHKDTSAVPSEMFLGPRTCHPYLARGPSVILVVCCMGCNQPEVPEDLENEDIVITRRH